MCVCVCLHLYTPLKVALAVGLTQIRSVCLWYLLETLLSNPRLSQYRDFACSFQMPEALVKLKWDRLFQGEKHHLWSLVSADGQLILSHWENPEPAEQEWILEEEDLCSLVKVKVLLCWPTKFMQNSLLHFASYVPSWYVVVVKCECNMQSP